MLLWNEEFVKEFSSCELQFKFRLTWNSVLYTYMYTMSKFSPMQLIFHLLNKTNKHKEYFKAMPISFKLMQVCFDILLSNMKLAREEKFCSFCKYGLQKGALNKIKQNKLWFAFYFFLFFYFFICSEFCHTLE